MRPKREVAWAVPRAGKSHAQVEGEVAALGRQVDRLWSAHFPVRQGYITLTEELEGPVEGVRLKVMRGDFRAEVDLHCGWNRLRGDARALAIMMQSNAHSNCMRALQKRGQRRIARLRLIGGALGFLVFVGLFWPIFAGSIPGALSMMFGFVLLGLLPAGGAVTGGYVGERLADQACARQLTESSSNEGLQTDFRRWRAFARQVTVQRRAVARGSRSGPFRSEAQMLAEAG